MIALLVIDMQNAYFEDPELEASREQVVKGCNELITGFTSAGHKVLVVRTEHERDKSTWTLNMLDDDQGFIFRGSHQAELVAGLQVDGHPQLLKTRDSAFVDTDLLARLRNWNVGKVVLAGVSTHNCLAQTAADAFARNIRVTYARDAMASEDKESEADMLRILTDEYRQDVRTNQQILAELPGR
ncbi:isochorismatase family cysteine hydrolase [Pseudarthrobacter sp. J75]|uniref:cysteine hydrolase family protein n=1 Tax=unclassified Pseudarthrobacter TaxID=2647000 RepID=UPI002E82228B|nr:MULTISPECIES: isochorismatase family cysteine hydrolase [unclassified Pseudarthrobacter]MEE2521943.1 isochorismatase family cysteine hydrolase [Pseudarthrobacter sp. J47]MEE2528868.1 isochorismatase family cysteine hydrolase [Pseudarthrobacter sp. J75]MEE2569935.1 isochorismatase family cysteine hydrolase [Pseudarthrobacter sp. J64]